MDQGVRMHVHSNDHDILNNCNVHLRIWPKVGHSATIEKSMVHSYVLLFLHKTPQIPTCKHNNSLSI